jgi:hypothetical protein
MTGSRYRSGRAPDWLKFKNPEAPAMRREAEEDWAGDPAEPAYWVRDHKRDPRISCEAAYAVPASDYGWVDASHHR